ncbi:MAG: cytochrome c, partial [Acidimicrobiia bacterium]|nr:cytochrome c [Acidimicrobiia bacterium]
MIGKSSTSIVGGTAAFLLALTVSLIANTSGSVATPTLASQADGAQIYNERCSSCHQPGGVGLPGTFPPLTGNPNSADADYVDQVVREGQSGPIEVLGVTYDAVMPPVELSDGDRAAVVEYVVGLASAEAADTESATPVAPEPVVADPDHGRRLFIGATGFANGGAACSGCHQAG